MIKVVEVWRQRVGLISYGLTKNSPYRIFIDDSLIKLFESGQIQKTIEKWKNSQQNCASDEKKLPLGFEKLIFVFMVYSFGVFISLIMFAYERISFGRKNEKYGANEIKINQKVKGIRKRLQMIKRINEELISLLEDSSGEIALE